MLKLRGSSSAGLSYRSNVDSREECRTLRREDSCRVDRYNDGISLLAGASYSTIRVLHQWIVVNPNFGDRIRDN
jgi:hypothetical protein